MCCCILFIFKQRSADHNRISYSSSHVCSSELGTYSGPGLGIDACSGISIDLLILRGDTIMATTWNRRDFLNTGSAATLAALAAGAPMASMLSGCSLTGSKIKPTADTVILLWMAGGMAHTETFDPKHYEP